MYSGGKKTTISVHLKEILHEEYHGFYFIFHLLVYVVHGPALGLSLF